MTLIINIAYQQQRLNCMAIKKPLANAKGHKINKLT